MTSFTTPFSDLPPELLAQLSALPEEAPEDFTCVICRSKVSNQWKHSPRDYQRPPVCISCESVTGYSWNGRPKLRTVPAGGTWRDRREAMRIGALADAIADEAKRRDWNCKHGIA